MNDFQQALAALQATDLSFLAPNPSAIPSQKCPLHMEHAAPPETENASTPTPPRCGEHEPSACVPASESGNAAEKPPRTRQHVEHAWPPVGTVVSGDYFGTVYRAEVVKANKPLKSGRQLKLMDGPAKGKRLDSFTKALLVATARQRQETRFGRKQASNGWAFWKPEAQARGTS